MARKVKINVGDRVAYRVNFLRSIGMVHSDLAHARGTVTEISPLGKGSSTMLAQIKWDSGDFPERVNVQNLARVGSIAFTSEDA